MLCKSEAAHLITFSPKTASSPLGEKEVYDYFFIFVVFEYPVVKTFLPNSEII